jgi:hypothetical protein
MTRTFLLALELSGSDDLDSIAADIQDSLETDGLTVLSVKPWMAPNSTTPDFGIPELPQISLSTNGL